jgi:hypothetical protein
MEKKMYGKSVKIDDRYIWVPCTPATSDAEVLRRAANIAEREDKKEKRPAGRAKDKEPIDPFNGDGF